MTVLCVYKKKQKKTQKKKIYKKKKKIVFTLMTEGVIMPDIKLEKLLLYSSAMD